MGFLSWLVPSLPDPADQRLTLSTPTGPLSASGVHTTNPSSPLTRPISVVSAIELLAAQSVTRAQLHSIPAFRKAILIISSAGSIPLHQINKDGERTDPPWMVQPERLTGRTRSQTWCAVAEELLLYGSSLMIVKERDSDGRPTTFERQPWLTWDQDPHTGAVIVGGTKVPTADVRLFSHAWPGLVEIAAPTVAVIHALRLRVAHMLDNPSAREYLQPAPGTFAFDDDEVESILADWVEKRRRGITAYLPPEFTLGHVPQQTAAEMLLQDAQAFAIGEVARLTGVDPSELGIDAGGSRTYTNRQDLKYEFVNAVLNPLILDPISQRMSMDDTVPHGSTAVHSLDWYLRANTLDRMAAYVAGRGVNAYTEDEIRDLEHRPRLSKPEGTP